MCHYIVEVINRENTAGKIKVAYSRIPVVGDAIKLPGVEKLQYVKGVSLFPIDFNNKFTGGKLQEQAVSALVFAE